MKYYKKYQFTSKSIHLELWLNLIKRSFVMENIGLGLALKVNISVLEVEKSKNRAMYKN